MRQQRELQRCRGAGMGGLSLGPEVLGEQPSEDVRIPDAPDLRNPAQVRAMERGSNIGRPLLHRIEEVRGTDRATRPRTISTVSPRRSAPRRPGHCFIAVTDPLSLDKVARQQGFAGLSRRAEHWWTRPGCCCCSGWCRSAPGSCSQPIEHRPGDGPSAAWMLLHENPAVQLGVTMGLAGLEGDKVTIFLSPKIAVFVLGRAADRGPPASMARADIDHG